MTKFHGVEMGEFTSVNGERTVAHQFYTGGWTCAFCNFYVVYGQPHNCSVNRHWWELPPPQQSQFQFIYPDPSLIELQNLLRQLIEKVDQLIETFERE